jgi:hypothetical protein
MRPRFPVVLTAAAIAAALAFPAVASANHTWSGYHWQHSTPTFTVDLADNVSGTWDSMLNAASSDWTAAAIIDTRVVNHGENPASCDPTLGRVEVCNANYGSTGWLGVAQVWLYVGGKHIAQGTVKNNDYYFGSSSYQYNNSAEQQHVICQEIGHTLGLDHQSETGAALDTCMDYYHNTSSSDLTSTHPNQGDYDELRCIYDPSVYRKTLSTTWTVNGTTYTHTCKGTGHLDGSGGGPGHGHGSHGNALFPGVGADASSWGHVVASSASGKEQTFFLDLGDGRALMTFVIWV